MKIPGRANRARRRSAVVPAPSDVSDRARNAVGFAIDGAARILVVARGTARATQAGAGDTTMALQTLPDSTLRSLAATSVGLGTGLFLARKSRLVVLAGVVPALLAAAAIIVRPMDPAAARAQPAPPPSSRRWIPRFRVRRSD